MLRFLLALLLFTGASSAHAQAFDHGPWDLLLRKNVVALQGGLATKVDYRRMQADRVALRVYLSRTSAVTRNQFDAWPRQVQLAFLINVYNAWTVELVLTGYPRIASIKDLGSFLQSPWKKPFIPLLGATRSLDDIEHGLIRGSGRYRDPRIHFAVNCASMGCPALRREAYRSAVLDTQLESATKNFLADRTRNRPGKGAIHVSSIFKWYGDDFAQGWRGAGSVAQFLALYANSRGLSAADAGRLKRGDLPIRYLDYDWRLNATR
jgi:hypothetical protein